MKIKDKYTLGIIAAIISNIIKNIFDYSFYLLNISEHPIYHIAASAYFPTNSTNTISGLIIGIITDYAVASILGLVIVYILFYTSSKYFWVKGISVGLLSWLFIFGIILRMKIGRIEPIDPGTNLVNLAEHILLGGAIAFFIVKFGEESLSYD